MYKMQALLLALFLTYQIHNANAQCREPVESCLCDTEVFLVRGFFSSTDAIDALQEQVARGILDSSPDVSIGVGSCDDGFFHFTAAPTDDFDDVVDGIADQFSDNGFNEVGDCFEDIGNAVTDDTSVRRVVLYFSNQPVDYDNLQDEAQRQLKSKGIEFFAIDFRDVDNRDEDSNDAFSRAVTFPGSSHFFAFGGEDWTLASALSGRNALNAPAYACNVWGSAAHITTFDGFSYEFQGAGEYWLTQSADGSVDVQVLLQQCDGPTGTSCVTAVAIRDEADTYEISRMSTGRVVIRQDGELEQLVSGDVDDNIRVSERQAGNETEGWNVIVELSSSRVEIRFSDNGAMVWIIPAAHLRANTEGLCGTFTSCPAKYIDEEMEVHDALFNRDGVADPDIWDAAESWKVGRDESLFYQRTVAPASWSPTDDSIPNAGQNYAHFEACIIFCRAGVSPDGVNNLEECADTCYPAYEGPSSDLREVLINQGNEDWIPDNELEGEDTPSALFITNENLGGQYTVRLNSTNLCGPRSQTVVINIACGPTFDSDAGRMLEMSKTPIGYPEVRMNGNIDGESSLVSWAFTGLPYTAFFTDDGKLYRNGGVSGPAEQIHMLIYDTPLNMALQLNSTLTPEEWDFYIGESFDLIVEVIHEVWEMRAPTIRGNHAKQARWQPEHAGPYELQFAGSDGCQVFADHVRVVADCGDCDPVAAILVSDSDADRLIQGEIDTSEEKEIFETQSPHFPAVNWLSGEGFDEITLSVSPGRPDLGLEATPQSSSWRLRNDTQLRDHEYEMDENSAEIIFINRTVERTLLSSFAGEYNETAIVDEIIEGEGSSTCINENTLDEHPWYLDTLIKNPPFEYCHAYRRWSSQNTSQVTVNWTLDVYQPEELETLCTIGIDTSSALRDSDSVEFTVDVGSQDNPLDCEGTYTVDMEVWNECSSNTDSIDIQVQCGDPPVAIINCIPTVDFDYNVGFSFPGSFPSLSVSGRMSYSASFADFSYQWDVIGWPDRDFTGLDESPSVTNAVDATLNLPRRDGEYELQLTVSNGCRWHSMSRIVTGLCHADAPVATIQPATTQNLYYTDPVNEFATLYGNFSTYYMQDEGGVVQHLWYAESPAYNVSHYVPQNPTAAAQLAGQEDVWLASGLSVGVQNVFNDPASDITGFFPRLQGNYRITLTVDDGCKITPQTLTIVNHCALTWDIDLSMNAGVFDLQAEQGRYYLQARAVTACDTTTPNDVCLNTSEYAAPPSPNRMYEWIWISDLRANLNDFADIRPKGSTPGNLADAFFNPTGIYVVPDRFPDSNIYPNNENPCSDPHCTSFSPRELGTYVLALVTYDGCFFRTTFDTPNTGRDSNHLSITVECSTFTELEIDTIRTGTSYTYADGLEGYLAAHDNNVGTDLIEHYNIAMQWGVLSAPENSPACGDNVDSSSCNNQFNSSTSLETGFLFDAAGDWEFSFEYSVPLCNHTDTRLTVTVTVGCANDLPLSSVSAVPAISTWNDTNGHFPLVSLSGVHGADTDYGVNFSYVDDVQFIWTVISAPADSVYLPQCYDGQDSRGIFSDVCRSAPSVTPVTVTDIDEAERPAIVNESDYEVVEWIEAWRSTSTAWQSYVVLEQTQSSYSDHENFRACFFPDVPGSYELELQIIAENCGSSHAVVDVTAVCNTPLSTLTIVEPFAVAQPAITPLTGTNYARIPLDASSIAADPAVSAFSRFAFWWEWAMPVEDPITEQEMFDEWVYENVPLVNSDTATPHFLASRAGTYYPTLVITDGCMRRTVDVSPVIVPCTAEGEAAIDSSQYDFDVYITGASGAAGHVVDLEPYAPTDKNWCAMGAGEGEPNYEWDVMDYDPEFEVPDRPAQSTSAATTATASVALVAVLAVLAASFSM